MARILRRVQASPKPGAVVLNVERLHFGVQVFAVGPACGLPLPQGSHVSSHACKGWKYWKHVLEERSSTEPARAARALLGRRAA
ncbi:hypothetical protein WJX84_011607 [Apatococcus fuscideae]|uniref:Uncharacterized protein n=1 Tax=Apatococcus fuscideae TaxID=2026836 RepID=A0AAW1TG67_9CHLO